MPKILVVDDEPGILNLVTSYLKSEGYEVRTASDGTGALKSAKTFDPDLIILDLMLPGLDGLEVLAQLRRESNVYVILLTARTEELDKILGLSVGADDYITKPFSPRELTARVKSALRRVILKPAGEEQESVLVFRHLTIDPGSRKTAIDGHSLELTAIEFDLLRVLAENHGRVLTREQLSEKVWGHGFFSGTRVVDVHLGHVRQKLGLESIITTIRGIGYRFDDEEI